MGTATGNQDSTSIFFSQAPCSKKKEKKHILPKYHDDEDDVVLDEEETTTFLTGEKKGDAEKQNGQNKKVQAWFWYADDDYLTVHGALVLKVAVFVVAVVAFVSGFYAGRCTSAEREWNTVGGGTTEDSGTFHQSSQFLSDDHHGSQAPSFGHTNTVERQYSFGPSNTVEPRLFWNQILSNWY